MSQLADVLAAHQQAIVERYTSQRGEAGGLRGRLPGVLRALERSLREADRPASGPVTQPSPGAPPEPDEGPGGDDLATVVRDYGLLRDCIYDQLEAVRVTPALHELRLLSRGLSAGILGHALADIAAQRQADHERERLLERESAARRQAEEATRLRDEFLATVSHELRTPLTSVLGWVQMLRAGGLGEAQQARAHETIERNARAQAQLIDDLLDMSRILSGKLRLEVEPLDVAAVVAASLETVRPAADARGVRLQATLGSGGLVMGDAGRLQQIVWNLLTNAVKFTPREGRVRVTVACLDSSVEAVVSDTGQGIEADFLPHVFDRFRQAEGGTSRRHGGLGLGLSIVRQLVELHGGTVRADSEGPGQGATFTVRLPLSVTRHHADVKSDPRPPTPPPSTATLHELRLLVVDDEEDTRELLGFLLESQGAQVRLAASAAEARSLFDQEPPDVLVSDIGMPRENGYALIESIRRRPREQGGDVPAVALTAYARTEDRMRALTAGFSNHVAKPAEPDELFAVIASLARYARLRRP